MEALVYGAGKASSSKRRQFQVHLNRPWQAATTSSDADRQKAIKGLEPEIHRLKHAKHILFKNHPYIMS